MSTVVPFDGTPWTHEVVIDGVRRAYATSLQEALVVARAVSRAASPNVEVRVYPAYANLPHTSFRAGLEVR